MNENYATMQLCRDLAYGQLAALLGKFGLRLEHATVGEPIPGSYWGDVEAGLVGNALWVRPDTPVHSALHEACHYVCMDADRRRSLHTDAGGDDLEECGVCYLQILLADLLPAVGGARLMADMDAWGYSFRLGSTRAWFEGDAEDALAWLQSKGLVDRVGKVTFELRQEGPSPTRLHQLGPLGAR